MWGGAVALGEALRRREPSRRRGHDVGGERWGRRGSSSSRRGWSVASWNRCGEEGDPCPPPPVPPQTRTYQLPVLLAPTFLYRKTKKGSALCHSMAQTGAQPPCGPSSLASVLASPHQLSLTPTPSHMGDPGLPAAAGELEQSTGPGAGGTRASPAPHWGPGRPSPPPLPLQAVCHEFQTPPITPQRQRPQGQPENCGDHAAPLRSPALGQTLTALLATVKPDCPNHMWGPRSGPSTRPRITQASRRLGPQCMGMALLRPLPC